ncbi:hypothetical protein CTAYLR_005749 [Chrysophaeum taylorii]|uniref:S1 motif domain-containing protein n=1 Tax=Chrysophaeum taylorii TaxID=2483200 RepID=A0AAD7UIT0_9STRA|nr:hypothetical protein CTAYLR_005749 [Chrysophaeum taylorii]
MSDLFPRGGLDGPSTKDTIGSPKKKKQQVRFEDPDEKAAKKKKTGVGRKRKGDEEEALFGTHRKRQSVREEVVAAAGSRSKDPVEAWTRSGIKAGKLGQATRVRASKFSSYHDQVWALGVVRTASEKHALVSLPGALVGHVDLEASGAVVVAGEVVRCAVTATGRASRGGRRGAKRIELSVAPRLAAKGLRLDDLASGRVGSVCGLVTSREARGFVLDLGVAGVTGFLAFKRAFDADAIAPSRLVECRVLRANTSTGVVELSRASVSEVATAAAVEGPDWTLSSLLPGQLARCVVERKFSDGLAVSFLDREFAGIVDRDHLGGVVGGDLRDDETRFVKGSRVEARVLSVDRAAKLVRLTLLSHLVSLVPRDLPPVGTVVRGAVVRRIDDKIGAVLQADEKILAFVHVSKLPDGKPMAVGDETDARVVGSSPLEGWAIATARPESLDPATPIARSDLRPGLEVSGVVVEAAAWGCRVRLSETLVGEVTNAQISDVVPKVDPRKRFGEKNKKRDRVACKVLRVEDRRVLLTMKPSLVADRSEPLASYARAADAAGRSFKGFVTGADAARGLVVTFYNGVHGRVPPASLAARGRDPTAFGLGEVVRVAVRRCALRSGAKPRLVLALAEEDNDNDDDFGGEEEEDGAAAVEPGAVFEAATVVELAKTNRQVKRRQRRRRRDGSVSIDEAASVSTDGAPPAPAEEVTALVRVAGRKPSFLGRLAASETADHGGHHGVALLRARAKSKTASSVVVLEPPAAGAIARLSAQPELVRAARAKRLPLSLDEIRAARDAGTAVTGVVSAAGRYGLVVRFANRLKGLVPKSSLADEFVDDPAAGYAQVGDAVRCGVVRVEDEEDKDDNNSKKSGCRVVLAMTGVPREKTDDVVDGPALFAATAAAEDAAVRGCDDVIKLGTTTDARVLAKGASGLRLVPADVDDDDAATYEMYVDASRALACATGDVVKVRALHLLAPARRPRLACTMEPDLVRAGRKKRRLAAVAGLQVGAQVQATLLPDSVLAGGAACLALVAATSTLALVPLGDFHARSAKKRNELLSHQAPTMPLVVASHSVSEILARHGVTLDAQPYAALPVLVPHPPEEEEEETTRDGDQKSPAARKKKLEAVADVGDLEVGDDVDCRVLEVGERELKCSVRVDDPTKRASATVDASDVFLVEDNDAAASPSEHPLFGAHATVGAVLRCRVLMVDRRSEKGSDGKERFAIRAALLSGRGSDARALEPRPLSWKELENGGAPHHLDAVILSKDDATLQVAVSPGLQGSVRVVDVANALYEDARSRTARSDDDGALLDEVLRGRLDAATRPGARLVVAPHSVRKRTLTVWLDDEGRPRRPPEPGVSVVARFLKSSEGGLDVRFELPHGLAARAGPTEMADKGAWVDVAKRAEPSASYVRVVVLGEERSLGASSNLKKKAPPRATAVFPVSVRPSRLALVEAGDGAAAAAADPEPRPGDVVPGFVRRADPRAGVFVELARDVVGRVLLKDLSDGYVEDVVAEFFAGRLVAPVVLGNVDNSGRVDLSLRPSAIANEGKIKVVVEEGAKLSGVVTRVETYGVFVKLDDAPRGYESGLAHISELADGTFIADVHSRFKKGDKVKAMILKEENEEMPLKKRSRRALAIDDEEAEAREAELAAGGAPRTEDDYERQLVGEPDSGVLWTRYVAHKVAETDVGAARRIAERALRTISYRKEAERMRVWLALVELELDHGTSSTYAECLERACAANDPENVLIRVAALHTKRGDHDRADETYRKAERRCKSKLKPESWILHCRERLVAGDAQGARAVLDRALQANDDHPGLLSRFAVAEFEVGDRERGRTVFDKLLVDQPKRVDLWHLYIAKTLKSGDIQGVRTIYERMASAPLVPKAMHAALKRFVDFEQSHGDASSVAKVRLLAKNYVASKLHERQSEENEQ